MILYMFYIDVDDENEHPGHLHQRAVVVTNNSTILALQVAEKYLYTEKFNIQYGDVPPFVLPWMYMAGVRLLKRCHDDGSSENMEKLAIIENTLQKLDHKWKAAGKLCLSRRGIICEYWHYPISGVYLKLLAARQAMTI